jgi:broad specificity phosphatase PhoE
MALDHLILVRHGETLHNLAGIVQGWEHGVLSERGERQVKRLAERLSALGVTALFSSPLQRAMATARAINETTGLEIQTLDDLREMSYGDWEGQSFLDVRKKDEAFFKKWIGDPECQCPAGESHNDVRRRMEKAFRQIDAIVDARPGGVNEPPVRAVVVTHGTAIRVAATLLLNVPVMTSRHLAQDNASINIFMRRGDRMVLKVWNDSTHCGE